MPDEETPEPESWQIEIDHSAYYRWLPVKDEDIEDGMVLIEATWPGFHLYRTVVEEETTTTTGVNVPSLRSENDDREAAGLSRRSDVSNLIRHLEDGPWPKHFPMESITAVRCSDPTIETALIAHFAPVPA